MRDVIWNREVQEEFLLNIYLPPSYNEKVSKTCSEHLLAATKSQLHTVVRAINHLLYITPT
jgi:hypothetical protein